MSDCIERAKQAFIHRDFEDAINEYNKALKELPDDQLFVAYSNRGAALMNTGRVKEAIRCFRKALELNPEHYESMHNMGVAFAAQKQFDKALECFEKTLEFAPYFYASHCGKSEALASLNRYDEAVDAAKDGIQEDPNEPIAYADLAFAYLKLGRFEDAVKNYERAHGLKDRSPETSRLHAVALSEQALVCERRDDLSRALELYLRSLQKHETPLAYHNLGVLYVRQRQTSKARSAFSKALKLDSNYFASNAALGALLAKDSEYETALPYLINAYETDTKDIENLYNLALVQMKVGDHESALAHFRTLLRADPSNDDARLAVQILRGSSGRSSSLTRRPVGSAGASSSSRAPSRGPRPPMPADAGPPPPRRRDRSLTAKQKRSASRSNRKKKLFSVEELQRNPPPLGVDPGQREMYLHEQEFVELFGMTKEEFIDLPYWKQTLEKKKYKLF